MTDFALNCERTPSCDELSSLMLQDVDFGELTVDAGKECRCDTTLVADNGEPGKDRVTPFTTSITSLDNGYQGDGEWSRPASRGAADHSPSKPAPPPPKPDPMTDSDFFTESDADPHDEVNHRKAQIIDGTLYTLPFAAPPQRRFSPANEEMDSSGVYSDLDRQLSDAKTEERPCSPEGSTRTVSSKSDQSLKKMSPTSFTELINEQVATIKSLVACTVEEAPGTPPSNSPPPPPLTPSPPSGALTCPEPLAPVDPKKYKMPKRNVVSKIKTMITGSKKDQENRVPTVGPAASRQPKKGRWDEVMSKIAQGKEEERNCPRVKEVKSRVFQGLGALPPAPLPRKSLSAVARGLGAPHSVSTRSLRDIPQLKSKSRRCRLRGSETCLPGESQASSRNSSVSDVSQGTLTKASTPSSGRSGKKRDNGGNGGRCGSPQVETGRKPSSPPLTTPTNNHKATPGKNVQGVEKSVVQQQQGRKGTPRRSASSAPAKPIPLRDQNRVSGGGVGVRVGGGAEGERVSLPPPLPPPPPPPAPAAAAAFPGPGLGLEALSVLVNYLVYTLDAFSTPKLKTDLDKMKSEWIKTKLDLEESQVSCKRLQENMITEKAEHEKSLAEMVEKHLKEMAEASAIYQQQLLEVTTKYNEKMTDIENTFKKKEAELKYDMELLVEEARMRATEETQRVRDECQKKVNDTQNESSRMCKQAEEARAEASSLHLLLDQAQHEVSSLRTKLSLCTDKDTKSAFGRISELESEVSSLQSVLELRSAELQEQRRKSESWRRDAEQLPGVLTKVTTLQARLEDLQERLQTKEALEQRLLQENRTLMESVNHETKQKKRLSLHNEELQWKLKQNTEVANALVALYGGDSNSPLAVRMPRSPKSVKRLSFNNSTISRTTFEQDINGTRSGGGDSSDGVSGGGSPPSSPKVKAVVEKSDSVAWVLDMDDPPEYVASRILRRAQSLRAAGSSPCPATPVHCSRTLPKPRNSKSLSSPTSKKEWGSGRGTEGHHVREEVIVVRDATGVLELFGPEDDSEIHIDAGKPDEETRAMIRRVEGRGSPAGLPKESGGEAMVSGETSDQEEEDDPILGGYAEDLEDTEDTEEEEEEEDSCSSSTSEPKKNGGRGALRLEAKILRAPLDSSSNNTAVDLSWSEDADILPSSEG